MNCVILPCTWEVPTAVVIENAGDPFTNLFVFGTHPSNHDRSPRDFVDLRVQVLSVRKKQESELRKIHKLVLSYKPQFRLVPPLVTREGPDNLVH